MITPFMRYVLARLKQYQRDEAYRFYVSDVLRAVAINTAGGNERMTINMSLHEILTPAPKETRTDKEIIADIRDKITKIGGA